MASFASSYIPTTASQATRAADQGSMTGTNFSSWYNAVEGTIFAEFDHVVAPLGTGNKGVYCAYLNASNNIVAYSTNSTGNMADVVLNAGASQAAFTSVAVLSANTFYKDAFGYKDNSFARSLSGATVQTDSVGTVTTGLTTFRIGWDDGAAPTLNGHIRTIRYYSQRLPNSTLQSLTA